VALAVVLLRALQLAGPVRYARIVAGSALAVAGVALVLIG
jgi:hypothetical protein